MCHARHLIVSCCDHHHLYMSPVNFADASLCMLNTASHPLCTNRCVWLPTGAPVSCTVRRQLRVMVATIPGLGPAITACPNLAAALATMPELTEAVVDSPDLAQRLADNPK